VINSDLLIQKTQDSLWQPCISKEVFKLLAILLPFEIMLAAFESRDCSLSEIVPLVREVQADMRNVSCILETELSRCILRMILTRFIAPVLRNNHEEAIAAYYLTAAGREELPVQ
jgi:hypothetical protein